MGPVIEIIRRHGLAAACIVGPILLGLVATNWAVDRLVKGSNIDLIRDKLTYALRDAPRPSTTRVGETATSPSDSTAVETDKPKTPTATKDSGAAPEASQSKLRTTTHLEMVARH